MDTCFASDIAQAWHSAEQRWWDRECFAHPNDVGLHIQLWLLSHKTAAANNTDPALTRAETPSRRSLQFIAKSLILLVSPDGIEPSTL